MPGITREAGQQEEIAPRPVRLMQLGMACKAKRTRRIGSAKLPNKQKPELTKSPHLYSKDPSLRVSSFQPQCVKAWNLAASECTVPVPPGCPFETILGKYDQMRSNAFAPWMRVVFRLPMIPNFACGCSFCLTTKSLFLVCRCPPGGTKPGLVSSKDLAGSHFLANCRDVCEK